MMGVPVFGDGVRWVTTAPHFVYEVYALSGDDSVIPAAFHCIWEQYCAYVAQMQTPAEKRYLQLHDGHSIYLVPGERRFVTPEAIKATTLVGSPEEICARVRAVERAGLRELTVLPPSDTSREMLKEFSELVMLRY
jgi:alkanesulfonate monooxygenase SsuD/methylene tetrahydromethanopterin reductase-like flavin-dependent oxidoreductase (luciferase family)